MSLMTDGHDAPPGVYQIRVQGRLDAHWSDWLGGLAMTYAGPNGCDTLLCGPVVDQAALYGLLIKIRDLGVPLLAVQRLDADPGHGGMPAQQPGAALQQTKRKAGDMQRTETRRSGRRTIMTMTTTPLQQQIDAFNAQARSRVPEHLVKDLTRPIEQLRTSQAAERALKEGERAPDFTLPDAFGHPVTLAHLLQQGPVVLTFYRGEWCPYCNLELRAYQRALPRIQELGASLVAISPQTPDHSLSTADKNALTFAVLSDVGNTVARQFGLVFTIDAAVRAAHQQVGADLPAFNGDESWDLPMAGTFIIDPAGTVRLAFVDPDFRHRLDPSAVVARLIELQY